jgi:ribosomal protein S18 acetylase RimI-like enzyme
VEDDFSDPEEYQKAVSEWEDERQRIEDEAADSHRKENLPYCLDDAVIEDVEKTLMQTQIKLPRWFSKYFNKKQDNRSHYPTILWTLEGIARKKKEAIKGKKKRRASGWYNICKFSESFLVKKVTDIYAITFDQAKRSDLIEDGNKFKSNGSYTFVDDSKMICRDEDYNMWVEDVSDFDKRYKIKDGKKKQIRSPFKEGFWQRYEPTENAKNIVEEVSEDEVLLKEDKNNGDEWEITIEEYGKNYKKANGGFSPDETKSNIEIEDSECINNHRWRSDMIMRGYDTQTNELVGQLSYSVFGNELHISMIEIVPKYRRQGVGTLLIKKMKEENPGLVIKPGLMTNDGYSFFKALKRRRVI